MEILVTASQGLSHADAKLDRAARRLSQVAAAESDWADLGTEAVNLTLAKEEFLANLKTLQAGNEIARHAIDILA